MRIVHECLFPMQASGSSGGPYTRSVDQEARKELATGFPITALATTDPNYESYGDEEVIHLEGDAFHVREMLLDWIEMIDIAAADFMAEGTLDPKWLEKSKAQKSLREKWTKERKTKKTKKTE